MQISIKKTKLTATIAIVLLITSAFILMINAPVQAQDEYENMQEGGSVPLPSGVTADLTLETKAYLSFRPNPVGDGQTILVNLWITPPLHVSRYFSDFKVTITDPDGNEEIVLVDSYRADATAWFEYQVDQVGDWTLKFDFLGGYFPAGNYTVYEGAWITRQREGEVVYDFPEDCYYKPSSTGEQTLVVQEGMVYSWPPSPLPTDYWTRPVSPENREWWPILGNYPGNGIVGGGPYWPADTNIYGGSTSDHEFYPYVIGPNSAHVLWKRVDGIGGLIGGTTGIQTDTDSSATPNLVYAGRCYDTMTVSIDGVPTSCAVCYDLRTGEMYYAIPTSEGGYTPSYISYAKGGRIEVPGATESSGYSVTLFSLGSTMRKVNAETGSVSEYPGMSGTFYADPYVLSTQNIEGQRYLINWTIAGSTDDFSERVVSNITIDWTNLGDAQDFESMIAFDVYGITPASTGVSNQIGVRAMSLLTGKQLWEKVVDGRYYSGSCTVADHGKGAVLMIGGYFLAYDLQTGNLAWKSELMDYPWSEPSFGAYDATSAYGMLYRQAYDGVYAFDWDDGSIVWHYKHPNVPYETPYTDNEGKGVYSFNSGSKAADGKIFTYNSEHTTTHPITRGWRIHCIDAYTGEAIWTLATPMRVATIADGYITANCDWQSTMYVIGKGKSATTVTAPDIAVPEGTAITIKGTVLDMSPAQTGTPCVSKDSMALQMEYLHMQRPIGGIWGNETITGVPVMLTAMGPDGSYIDIGTTTTDGYYGTFGHTWTPPDKGKYKIIASFEGDDSYGSSGASTYVTVDPAAEEVDLTPVEGSVSNVEESISSQTTYIIAILVLVIIALIIALYSAFKPRK
ncbi:MAG: hypothetical protein JSW14_00210 [Candidatus Bathyarchaeum sp.]|nr:MAG: hypothetical protein JSW14_00210 [Candidatus Bathyarchaeum sp.]